MFSKLYYSVLVAFLSVGGQVASADSPPVPSGEPIKMPEAVLYGSCLKAFEKYRPTPEPKAFAYARSEKTGKQRCNYYYKQTDVKKAQDNAIAACTKRAEKDGISQPCQLIDVNNTLVVSGGVFNPIAPLPNLALSGEAYDDLYDVVMPILTGSTDCRQRFVYYLGLKSHKAFAYTTSKKDSYETCTFAEAPTIEIAEATALKWCESSRKSSVYKKKHTPNCQLLARYHDILLSREAWELEPLADTFDNAVAYKSLRTIKQWVDNGADIHKLSSSKNSPLLHAAWKNRLDVVQYLVEKGADIHQRGSLGFNLLLIATQHKNEAMFQLAIDAGADIHSSGRGPGNQAIHFAARRGALKMLKQLIEKGVNLDVPNNFQETPLIMAADSGQLEVVTFLVENGANINHLNKQKATALDVAKDRNRQAVVDYLMAKGAKTGRQL